MGKASALDQRGSNWEITNGGLTLVLNDCFVFTRSPRLRGVGNTKGSVLSRLNAQLHALIARGMWGQVDFMLGSSQLVAQLWMRWDLQSRHLQVSETVRLPGHPVPLVCVRFEQLAEPGCLLLAPGVGQGDELAFINSLGYRIS